MTDAVWCIGKFISEPSPVTKKEIKEDKLISIVYKSESFFEEYKSKIYTYGLVLVVVAAAVYFFLNQKAEENELAGIELSRRFATAKPKRAMSSGAA